MTASRVVPRTGRTERRVRSSWLPAPGIDEPSPGLETAPGKLTARWRISFFEAVMLGVVGGAVGGGILGGFNASGAVMTVLTVEFGAVFGILAGGAIAVLLALASRVLPARHQAQPAMSQRSEPGQAMNV